MTQSDRLSCVISGRSGAAICLCGTAPGRWRLIGPACISGERGMPRCLLADRHDRLDALPRFGLEVCRNRFWRDDGLEIAGVPRPEVARPVKAEKRGGFVAGVRADLAKLRDQFTTVPPVAALRQILAMRVRQV